MLQSLIDQVWKALFSQGNQFLQGGLILGVLASVGYWLKSLPRKLLGWFMFHFSVSVDVLSTDKAYHWILLWLEKQPYMKRARRVSIRDVRNQDGDDKALLVPARGSHWFFHKGRPLWIQRGADESSAPSSAGGQQSMQQMMSLPRESISIRTIGRYRDRLNEIIEEARKLYEVETINKLKVYTRKWSDWTPILRRKRPIESVFMPPSGVGVLADMQKFIASENWYREIGIPYRRGYLFYGPAGTGKTSAAEALASELDIQIYIINLAHMSDAGLEQAIEELEHSKTVMILLEDVDTVMTQRADSDEAVSDKLQVAAPKLSLGTLLNALDGLTAGDNVILVMTTNHPDKLDSALRRKGRTDVHVEFGYTTDEQIEAAIDRVLPNATREQRLRIAALKRPFPFCDLQELLKEMALEGLEDRQDAA